MFSLETLITFLKKNFTRRDVLILAIILLLFFATRLINLDKWPQFSDEGIYIRWAKVAWKDASWRFISVTDGRQPLQTWATIPFLKIFSGNALFAGRLFSVSTGFAGLIGMFSLLFYLWGKRAAYIGAILYVFLPSLMFYDRFALVDSAVNAGFIWILFLSFVLVRTRRLDIAMIMGFVGGIALLAKSSSRMFLGLSAAAPVLYLNLWNKKKSQFFSQSINYFFLLGIVAAISLLFYNVQRLSPYFHYVAQKNITFILTPAEFLASPFAYFKNNFWNLPLYFTWEAGFAIVILSILGYISMMKRDRLTALYLSVFIFVPYLAISFFARVMFPRYVLFYASILVITATYFFLQIKQTKKMIAVLSVLIASMGIFIYPILFNPALALLPPVDRGQYVEGVTAVWGARELMSRMREVSQEKPVLILAEGNFGLVGDVLDVYLQDTDKIEIRGLWPLDETNLYENQLETKTREVYVVFSHRKEFPPNWPITLVKEYEKPGKKESLYLFKLLPPVGDSPGSVILK